MKFLFRNFGEMSSHSFSDLCADGHSWVQRSHGILEHHRKQLATEFVHFPLFICSNICIIDANLTGFYFRCSRKQLHDAFAQDTFTAPGFSNNRKNFSRLQGKTNIANGLCLSLRSKKTNRQILNF